MKIARIAQFALMALTSMVWAQEEAQTLTLGSPVPRIKVSKWLRGQSVETIGTGRVYVIDFWSSSYGPSQANIPLFTLLSKKYGDRVSFVGIGLEQSAEQGQAFLEKLGNGADYSIGLDDEEFSNARAFLEPVEADEPMTFLVDTDGHIAWYGEAKDVVRPLKRLLSGTWSIEAAKASEALDDKISDIEDAVKENKDIQATIKTFAQHMRAKKYDDAIKAAQSIGSIKDPKVSEDSIKAISQKFTAQAMTAKGDLKGTLAICDQMATWPSTETEGIDPKVYADKRRLMIYKLAGDAKNALATIGRLEKASEDDLENSPPLFGIQERLGVDIATKDLKSALTECDKLAALKDEDTNLQSPAFMATRSRVDIELLQGDTKGALAEIDNFKKCDELELGENADLFILSERLDVFYEAGMTKEFYQDLKDKATLIQNPITLNNTAWRIVDPESKLKSRDLEIALKLATQAVDQTERKLSFAIDTLAWVYYHKGEKAKAIELEQEAISKEMAEDRKREYQQTLKVFQAK